MQGTPLPAQPSAHTLNAASLRKAIGRYYKELDEYKGKADYELALRSAFQGLLAEGARSVGWTLIPEQTIEGGIRPDGVMRDANNLRRGYWEAKGPNSDLDREIAEKIEKNYPLTNTIFENTRRAVLFQGKRKVFDLDMTSVSNVQDVLQQFLTYTEPHIEKFQTAVLEFKARIPELARDLLDIIEKEHRENKRFRDAFLSLATICRASLDPNLDDKAIDEMLVQHLLTERIFRTVFNNSDFVGTGSFIVNLVRHHIPRSKLKHKYLHDLFCNEIMLLPYYIASLNIEHEYYERMNEYQPFEGICFADTLNLEGLQMELFSEKNMERIQSEKNAQIKVVIGNPPYNVGQKSENDNNKNRKYDGIDHRIKESYAKDSKATLKTQLYDAYMGFFRWATDRLQGRDGIVCFVSNNGFLNGIAFDGFRKTLLNDFNLLYHFDFKGDARTSGEARRAEGGNIFDDKIRTGIGITLLVRVKQLQEHKVFYHCVEDYQSARQKSEYLRTFNGLNTVPWKPLIIDQYHNWLINSLPPEFLSFIPIGSKSAKISQLVEDRVVFTLYSAGVKTNRDTWAYDFSRKNLEQKIKKLIDAYNTDADYSNANIRPSLYRPFAKQFLYFNSIINDRQLLQHLFFPTSISEDENTVICVSAIGSNKSFHCIAVNVLPDFHLTGDSQCFPYYTYAEDGSNRRENITDWALAQFQAKYGSEVTKWDIFHYVYALLHHPQYRERYAENLKRDLPHIPLLHRAEAFAFCVRAGKQLMELHLHYEQAREYPLQEIENPAVPFSYRVEKMRLSSDRAALVVNASLTLAAIPPECFAYRLGNRSALEWVIDQYAVSEDKRSGIVSDPNNLDDEEYIVRLVGRVITVSVETVRLVEELRGAVTMEDWMDAGGDGAAGQV